MALHCLVFVALSLILRASPRSLPPEREADRAVGIVIASREQSRTKEYFEENSSVGLPSFGAAALEGPAELLAAESTPPPFLDNVALPGQADVSLADGATSDLVARPGLQVSRVRKPLFAGLGDEAILAADVVRNKPQGPSGPPGKVSLFGSPAAVGHSFVFVIDRSNSMGEGGLRAIAAAEFELLKALGGLLPTHKFQIVAYNNRPAYFSESGLTEATESNRQAVKRFFTALEASGGTEHELAILAALRVKPDVLFLFTDGDPSLNTAQIERIVSRAEGATTFHCLQFGRGELQEKDNFLMRLADRTRGSYGYIDMNQARKAP